MSQTLCVECGVPSDATHCPLCALKRRVDLLEKNTALVGLELKERVEKLEQFKANSLSQLFIPHPSTVSASPLEPKLYSGFTADEWKQMLKDGPLLLEQPNKRLIWIDQFETEDDVPLFSWGDHITFIHEVKLIEQPNWRPHMTDKCPVPGRVKVFYATLDGSDSLLNSRRKEYGPMAAETINWANERICAYRILGV